MTTTVGLTDVSLAGRYSLPPGVTERVLNLLDPGEEGEEFVVARWTEDPADLEAIARLSRPCVIQTLSSGTNWLEAFVPKNAVLCSAAGTTEPATAEMAVALALASLRRISEFAAQQVNGDWESLEQRSLLGAKVGVVGYGRLGRGIATLLQGFQTDLTAFARSSRKDNLLGIEVLPFSSLRRLANELKIIFIAVPLDASTRGIIDAELLAALPHGALVVNVSRGPVLDSRAALNEARTGRLQFALDVWDTEPMPPDDPVRHTRGMLLTPHAAWHTDRTALLNASLIEQQIEDFCLGRPLRNVVPRPNKPLITSR